MLRSFYSSRQRAHKSLWNGFSHTITLRSQAEQRGCNWRLLSQERSHGRSDWASTLRSCSHFNIRSQESDHKWKATHVCSHRAAECVSTCIVRGHFWSDLTSPLYMQINTYIIVCSLKSYITNVRWLKKCCLQCVKGQNLSLTNGVTVCFQRVYFMNLTIRMSTDGRRDLCRRERGF